MFCFVICEYHCRQVGAEWRPSVVIYMTYSHSRTL